MLKEWMIDKTLKTKDSDKIGFRCQCGAVGIKSVTHAKRSLKEKGFAYQCRDCLTAKQAKSKGVFILKRILPWRRS